MRFRGWLTVSAGLGLGVLVVILSARLMHMGRHEAARDEARGLTEALRWRLDFDRAMLDLNSTSMGRALQELGRWPHPLEWAGLYGPGKQPISSAGDAAAEIPGDGDFQSLAAASPADLPVLRSLPDQKFLAMTRFRIGERDLSLAMVLAPEGWRPGATGIWSTLSTCLVALAAAALLLVWLGTNDLLTARRPLPGRQG